MHKAFPSHLDTLTEWLGASVVRLRVDANNTRHNVSKCIAYVAASASKACMKQLNITALKSNQMYLFSPSSKGFKNFTFTKLQMWCTRRTCSPRWLYVNFSHMCKKSKELENENGQQPKTTGQLVALNNGQMWQKSHLYTDFVMICCASAKANPEWYNADSWVTVFFPGTTMQHNKYCTFGTRLP